MPFRRFTIWSSAIVAVAYLALMAIYLAAGRYGYAAAYLAFAIGWATLARLATKIPAAKRAATQGGWATHLAPLTLEVHVLPHRDIVEHETSEGCVCAPTPWRVERDDGGDAWGYTHHSLDGHELREPKP